MNPPWSGSFSLPALLEHKHPNLAIPTGLLSLQHTKTRPSPASLLQHLLHFRAEYRPPTLCTFMNHRPPQNQLGRCLGPAISTICLYLPLFLPYPYFISYYQHDSHQKVSCATLEFSTRSFIVCLTSVSSYFHSVTTVASAPCVLELVIQQPWIHESSLSNVIHLLLTPIPLTKSQPYGSAMPICMIRANVCSDNAQLTTLTVPQPSTVQTWVSSLSLATHTDALNRRLWLYID